MGVDWQEILFGFIGGIGIFLFGIKSMSDGLQKTAGDRMRSLLEKYTSNPIMGVIVGIVVTVLIQTSAGTTVIAIGLINAGLMTLRQAIGVIMGANIGTTATAFIIGIKIDEFALPIIGIGAVLLFFFKRKKYNYMGQIIFGFGMLFLGLKTMSAGLKPLRELEVFTEFIASVSDSPILGVIVGTVFTVIVQSSTATIGVLQSMAHEGIIGIEASLPVLFGDNIGSTIVAVIASIGATVAAKRAAAAHVIFNVIGTTIFIIFLLPVTSLVMWLGEITSADPRMQIAYAHGIFNTANTMIQLPFVAFLAWLVSKIIRGKKEELELGAVHLDPRLLTNPSVGLGQAQHEIIRMGQLAVQSLKNAADYLFNKNENSKNLASQLEQLINDLDRKTTEYIVQLHQNAMNEQESAKASVLMQTINDLERIGDHAENILELADTYMTRKVDLSDEAIKELKMMIEVTERTISQAIEALENEDEQIANMVLIDETELDRMEAEFRKNHINRMNNNLCSTNSGPIFLDILSNLERMGDHSKNIAQYVLYGE